MKSPSNNGFICWLLRRHRVQTGRSRYDFVVLVDNAQQGTAKAVPMYDALFPSMLTANEGGA